MDRRQQKTRDAIFRAFTELLSKKSYTKITVQEIINEANIGRSTFYAHFETRDELLKELCTDLFTHVFSQTLSSEHTHDFSASAGDPGAMIVHILYHLRDNRKNIVSLLSCESSELFLSYFKQYLREFVTAHLLAELSQSSGSIPEEFLINHITCSFIGMVEWWVRQGLKQSPEELAGYFEQVILPVIH